jgi:hypothetical protein
MREYIIDKEDINSVEIQLVACHHLLFYQYAVHVIGP